MAWSRVHRPSRRLACASAFLFGASAKAEVVNYVRTQSIPAEQDKLDETISDWVGANRHFRAIEQAEIGKAEQITLMDIPEEFSTFLKEVEDDFLFKQSFSLLPYEVKLVEIDKLVASQRAVNLDYVEILKKRVSPKPTIPELISFCLAPPKDITPPAEQILAQNVHSYTSENLDFRFLGGFQKPSRRRGSVAVDAICVERALVDKRLPVIPATLLRQPV